MQKWEYLEVTMALTEPSCGYDEWLARTISDPLADHGDPPPRVWCQRVGDNWEQRETEQVVNACGSDGWELVEITRAAVKWKPDLVFERKGQKLMFKRPAG